MSLCLALPCADRRAWGPKRVEEHGYQGNRVPRIGTEGDQARAGQFYSLFGDRLNFPKEAVPVSQVTSGFPGLSPRQPTNKCVSQMTGMGVHAASVLLSRPPSHFPAPQTGQLMGGKQHGRLRTGQLPVGQLEPPHSPGRLGQPVPALPRMASSASRRCGFRVQAPPGTGSLGQGVRAPHPLHRVALSCSCFPLNPALCLMGPGCGGIMVVSIPALERIPERILLSTPSPR